MKMQSNSSITIKVNDRVKAGLKQEAKRRGLSLTALLLSIAIAQTGLNIEELFNNLPTA